MRQMKEMKQEITREECVSPDNPPLHRKFWETAAVAQVEDVLDRGADPNALDQKYGLTLLHWAAAFSNKPKVIELLLNHGAKPEARAKNSNGRTGKGGTPLHWAAAFSNTPEVIKLLLNGGVDVNECAAERGFTPLHVAARFSETPKVVEQLLDCGAALEACADGGWTPLHEAARHNETPAVIKLLLKHGADGTAKDNSGRTPLDRAENRPNDKKLDDEAYQCLRDAQ